MNDCKRVEERLNDLLDGTLTASLAIELNEHIELCDRCRTEYRALEATRDLLRAEPVPVRSDSRERVLARFRHAVNGTETRPTQARTRIYVVPAFGAIAAAAAVLLITTRGRLIVPNVAPAPVAAISYDRLPTDDELNRMDALHSARSNAIMNADAVPEQESFDPGQPGPRGTYRMGEGR